MKREIITNTKGDASGTIEELTDFLNEAKAKGATHYRMSWSHDPMWAFKWFETYKEVPEITECPNCKNKLAEASANFCSHCGENLKNGT